MKKSKIIIISVLTVMVLSTIGGIYAYKEYNRKPKMPSAANADYEIDAANLTKEFETNQQAANAKFLNKIVKVSGTVKSVEDDGSGSVTVVLGDTSGMNSIRCAVAETEKTKAKTLETGKRVIVNGICTGFNADELLGSDVILNRCVIN